MIPWLVCNVQVVIAMVTRSVISSSEQSSAVQHVEMVAFWVSWSTIHYCDLPWPLLYDTVNNVIHKFLPIVRVENLWYSQDSKDMILKIDGYFCSRVSHEREYYMEFCPVIHVMANPFEATIWSVSHVNEVNLKGEKDHYH